MKFRTTFLSLRYGLNRRLNLNATIPYQYIRSDKFQGADYSRVNEGFGDLLLTGEYSVLSRPQVTLEAGLRLPTGNVDKVDEFGQRICDILALGSGTTDLVLGAGTWIPHAFVHDLSFVGRLRYRRSGGENKWGYRFGNEIAFSLHLNYPVTPELRLGLRSQGYHTAVDRWFGNVVPERGATMVYLGPTGSYQVTPEVVAGVYARAPVLMDLQGAQMVAEWIVGFEFSTNLTPMLDSIRGGE